MNQFIKQKKGIFIQTSFESKTDQINVKETFFMQQKISQIHAYTSIKTLPTKTS